MVHTESMSSSRDLDAAVATASRHGLSLTLVLFDFTWCARRRVVDGVALGGRRGVLARALGREALLEGVVRPILRRYGSEPAIAAWDLFNEPEWATWGYGNLNPFTSVRPAQMRRLLRDLAALVRAETRQEVTVGLASARGVRLLRGVDLDLLQLHWYRSSVTVPARRARRLRRQAGALGGVSDGRLRAQCARNPARGARPRILWRLRLVRSRP